MPTRYVALALGIALIAGIVALGMNEPDTSLLATDSSLSGTIEIDGSSTVFPITQAVAEEFRKVHPGVQVPVGVSGMLMSLMNKWRQRRAQQRIPRYVPLGTVSWMRNR